MGATSSTAAGATSGLPAGMNNLVGELGNDVQYEKGMGSSRFLKAIKARHRHGPLVVKTFLKPEAHYSLRPLVRRIRVEREALEDVPNVLTYQKVVETETAGYLIRQWVASNLYDRISTRPFLTIVEKKWITFQLLSAMKEARKKRVPHGDLKSENVLVTSSLSVYITDFASSFKQVYLPLNDPSDFNFYFGTSGRRTCYIAPERFYTEDSDVAKQKAKARAEVEASNMHTNGSSTDRSADTGAEPFKRDGKVTEAMDVFSLGCVIAELWRDGAPIFTLMQIFKYREHQFDVEPALSEIGDDTVRDMVRSMISLEPGKRKKFAEYLSDARGRTFPDIFYTFLHRYLTTLQRTSPRATAMAAAEAANSTSAALSAAVANLPSTAPGAPSAASEAGAGGSTNGGDLAYIFRAEADERIERLYEEWVVVAAMLDGSVSDFDNFVPAITALADGTFSPRERTVTPFRDAGAAIRATSIPLRDQETINHFLPIRLCIPGISPGLSRSASPILEDGPALLILSPLLANLRNTIRPSTKLHALDLLLHLSSRWLSDEAKLDRVLPFIVPLLSDESIMVRAAAVKSVVQLLSLVNMITFANALTFSEYIIPNLRPLTRDPSSIVRLTYAACLAKLVDVGKRYLQMVSAMRAEGIFSADIDENGSDGREIEDFLASGSLPVEAKYDEQLASLRTFFQEQATILLTDSSPAVKRVLLENIAPLCTFFGVGPSNDVLLSHMITFLNDRSWMLRQAFFDGIVHVGKVAGVRSVEDYVLPLMLQALSDPEEFVVQRVLNGLQRLLICAANGNALLSKAKVYDVVGAVAGFLCHPNHWLRTTAAIVISTAASQLSTTDVWAMLYPSVRPLLRCDIHVVQASSLLFAAKTPLSREVMQKAVQWASRAKSSGFWKPSASEAKGKAGLSNGLGREGIGLMAGRQDKALTKTPIQRSEEDDAYLDNLRSSGLSEEDEVKLVGLREYIARLAKTSSAIGASNRASITYMGSTINSEDANILPPLQIKSGLSVQRLTDVTPLTIFFSAKNLVIASRSATAAATGPDGGSVAAPASLRSQAADSSFSGRIARRRLGGGRVASDVAYLSPLEELRRRMSDTMHQSELPHVAGELEGTPDLTDLKPPSSLRPTSPTSVTSIVGSTATGAHVGQAKLGYGKALPAIASNTTTVTGTMSDRLGAREHARTASMDVSERTTPIGSNTAGTVRDGATGRNGLKGALEEGNDGITFSSTYEGQDPYIRAHLEAVYFATYRDKHPTWGPMIASGATGLRRRGGPKTTSSARATMSGSSNRRPEGNLIAYFTEHTGGITAIAVAPDHAFFLSGSEDGTVKVWDTARLEKNVTSRSRGTYSAQKGRITALTMLEASHCAASAASDGSVHVIRVEMRSSTSSLPMYGKVRLVSNFQLSNPDEYVTCLAQSSSKSGVSVKEAASVQSNDGTTSHSSSSTLILATSKNRVIILDLRTMQVLTNFQLASHFGSISTLCLDSKNIWLLAGTVGGVMCLWDLRFDLLLKTWRIGRPDEKGLLQVNACVLHPSRGKDKKEKWVMIAYERLNLSFEGEKGHGVGDTETLVETWDIDKTICVERFEVVYSRGTAKHKGTAADAIPQEETGSDAGSPHPSPFATGGQMAQDMPSGLDNPAQGIERLVKMLEWKEDLHEADQTLPGGDNGLEEAAKAEGGKHAATPIVPPANVKVLLAAMEGYSSSTPAPSAQVSGGWLDAGRLVAQESGNQAASESQKGPAGYLITAGQDRKIRFWDLGRAEKSYCLAAKEERGEFRSIATNKGGGGGGSNERKEGLPYRFIHQLPLHSSSIPSSNSSKMPARSPLILHQQTSQINTQMKAHKDAITALGIIESPFRCIVAGDQAGAIRVWE